MQDQVSVSHLEANINPCQLGKKNEKKGKNTYLEVIAKGPVTQHLEVGVVVGILSDIIKIVVLAT